MDFALEKSQVLSPDFKPKKVFNFPTSPLNNPKKIKHLLEAQIQNIRLFCSNSPNKSYFNRLIKSKRSLSKKKTYNYIKKTPEQNKVSTEKLRLRPGSASSSNYKFNNTFIPKLSNQSSRRSPAFKPSPKPRNPFLTKLTKRPKLPVVEKTTKEAQTQSDLDFGLETK